MLPFTCGEKKICSSIKMSQNILNMVVALFNIMQAKSNNYSKDQCNKNQNYT